MRVLAIMCHPDDMELNCSGTLIKYKKNGHDVIACHASNGNMGHMVIPPEELADIRRKEALKAGEIAGIEVISGEIDDLKMNSADREQLKTIVRIIRYANPDVIITHSPNDYCSDHRELSKLVFEGSFSATVPHFEPALGKATELGPLYYAQNSRGIDFIPTEYVDITDVMDIKEQMLACHESQVKWLKDFNHVDIIEVQRSIARARGIECGVMYAEGFRPLLANSRIRPYRLLP